MQGNDWRDCSRIARSKRRPARAFRPGWISNELEARAVPATLTLSPTALPPANVGTNYNEQLTATGGTGTISFTVPPGALPAGVTLSTAGLISGTPTTIGSFPITVTATDSATPANTGSQDYTLTVNAASGITITPGTLPNATVGTNYNQQLAGSGGTGPYTFANFGSLPDGLTLTSGGLLSGMPTTAGSSNFAITATDNTGATATQNYMLMVNAAPITISPNTLPDATVGSAYSQQLLGTGGVGTIIFAVTSGSLPAGLDLTPGGLLSGNPTTAGSSTFVVTGTDTQQNTGTQSYTINVNASSGLTFATTTLPNATVGTAYNEQLTTTGGTGAISFAVTNGNLPAGLTLSDTGQISGTPTTAGTSTFAVTATDSTSATAMQEFTLDVTGGMTAPPTVTGLQRFGFHDQPTMFVLSFSAPLNPTSAQDINNYTLVPLVGSQPGTPIPLASAVYDATNNTVTLNPAQLVYAYGQYQLTVNGTAPNGVQGASGAFLAGANGQPGTNYVQTFGMEILAGPNLPTGTSAAIAHRITSRWTHHIGPRFHLRTGASAAAVGTTTAAAVQRRRPVVVNTFHIISTSSPVQATPALATRRAHASAVDSALVAIVRSRHRR